MKRSGLKQVLYECVDIQAGENYGQIRGGNRIGNSRRVID